MEGLWKALHISTVGYIMKGSLVLEPHSTNIKSPPLHKGGIGWWVMLCWEEALVCDSFLFTGGSVGLLRLHDPSALDNPVPVGYNDTLEKNCLLAVDADTAYERIRLCH